MGLKTIIQHISTNQSEHFGDNDNENDDDDDDDHNRDHDHDGRKCYNIPGHIMLQKPALKSYLPTPIYLNNWNTLQPLLT